MLRRSSGLLSWVGSFRLLEMKLGSSSFPGGQSQLSGCSACFLYALLDVKVGAVVVGSSTLNAQF